MGLPGAQCGTTFVTFNSDDYQWWNLTAFDVDTGRAVFNLDTLALLDGARFAYVASLACL